MNSTIEKTSIINKVQNILKENYRLILIYNKEFKFKL